MKAFPYEIGTDFNFGSETQVDLIPTFDIPEIDPKLRFGHKNEFSTLPWPALSPEVCESIE